MRAYSILRCEPLPELVSRVYPNFIYNRFDLWTFSDTDTKADVSLWEYKTLENSIFFEVLVIGTEAKLGLWLTPIDKRSISRIVKSIFKEFPYVDIVHTNNTLAPVLGQCISGNHFRIELPEKEDELAQRLSKKGRYNIKREKRILNDCFNGFRIYDFPSRSKEAAESWRFYFKMKLRTHGVKYALNIEQYCDYYHVSDVYTLMLGEERIAAVFLSCEQCPIVYLENITYDPELSEYSPGQILYDEYLKVLVRKGKKGIFLLGGSYTYKKRYGSIEDVVYNCTTYRKTAIYIKRVKYYIRKVGHLIKVKIRSIKALLKK